MQVRLGPVSVRFAGELPRDVDPAEQIELQRERERLAAQERERLENWSA